MIPFICDLAIGEAGSWQAVFDVESPRFYVQFVPSGWGPHIPDIHSADEVLTTKPRNRLQANARQSLSMLLATAVVRRSIQNDAGLEGR